MEDMIALNTRKHPKGRVLKLWWGRAHARKHAHTYTHILQIILPHDEQGRLVLNILSVSTLIDHTLRLLLKEFRHISCDRSLEQSQRLWWSDISADDMKVQVFSFSQQNTNTADGLVPQDWNALTQHDEPLSGGVAWNNLRLVCLGKAKQPITSHPRANSPAIFLHILGKVLFKRGDSDGSSCSVEKKLVQF